MSHKDKVVDKLIDVVDDPAAKTEGPFATDSTTAKGRRYRSQGAKRSAPRRSWRRKQKHGKSRQPMFAHIVAAGNMGQRGGGVTLGGRYQNGPGTIGRR